MLETRKRLRILLAEDNAINREVAVRLLSKRGHKVSVAENNPKAVTAFDIGSFDMILMDVQMPEMDGFEAYRLAIRPQGKRARYAHSDHCHDRAHHERRPRTLLVRGYGRVRFQADCGSDELIQVTETMGEALRKSTSGNEPSSEIFDRAAALARVGEDASGSTGLLKYSAESHKLLGAVFALRVAIEIWDADALAASSAFLERFGFHLCRHGRQPRISCRS